MKTASAEQLIVPPRPGYSAAQAQTSASSDSALTQIERPLTRKPANADQLLVPLQVDCTATRANLGLQMYALLRWE